MLLYQVLVEVKLVCSNVQENLRKSVEELK